MPRRSPRTRGRRRWSAGRPRVEQAGSLGGRDDVVRRTFGVVPLRRRVGEPVAAQVHRDDARDGAEPSRDRRPARPSGRGRGSAGRPAPRRRPPQSRKWIRSPGSTSTTNPWGSAVASGDGHGASRSSGDRGLDSRLGHADLGYGPHAEAPSRVPASTAASPPLRRRRSTGRRPSRHSWSGRWRGIPPPFARALDEVAIVIADEPTREELRESGLDPDERLYGLYEGTPRTEWGADLVPFPNKITLYPDPARGGLPGPPRPRRGGPGDGDPRAGAPPRDRRRPPPRAGARVARRSRPPVGSSSGDGVVELRPVVDDVGPEDHRTSVASRHVTARARGRPAGSPRSPAAPGTTARTRRPRRGSTC